MSASLVWRPERLNARLIAAARPAAYEVAKAAQVRAATASKRVAAGIKVTGTNTDFMVASSSSLGMIIEKGTKSHTIEPKKKVLKLADGRFVTGGVRHPGTRAKPYLQPSLGLWASLYRRHAVAAFRGF